MTDRPVGLVLRAAATLLPLAASSQLAMADAPRVQFDMPYAVACRDVTPSEYPALHPGYKLMELKLAISTLLAAGQERDLTQYFIQIDSPQRPLSVVDYLPKTVHEATASAVTKEDATERVMALGVNLSGKYELLALPGPSVGIGEKKTSSVKYELLPPMETVTASGTLDRGSAVFFKIKATQRNLLEGAREYAVVIRVPTAWRADYLRVRCEADGIRRNVISMFDEPISGGRREFLVSLYQEGDEPARQIAENFARRRAAEQVENRRSKVESRSPIPSSPWAAMAMPAHR
jgi:hypothetical protein